MTQEGRRPFTADDKDHLAQFLIGIPLDKREAPSTHKEMERRHPEHSHQAWLNHYKKVDKDGIERRIERIRRQRERDKDAARSVKGKQRARDDHDLPDDDDNDNDDVQVKKPRPSTSRPTATDDAPAPTKNKKKKRKALELPRPSSSSSSDEDLVKARKRRAGCKKKYTAEDFKQLVRIMYRAEQESWLKQRIYTALEAYDPDHSAASWQTYHRDNRDSADASLAEYRQLKKGAKKTKKRRKREATTESAASSVLPPPHKKQKQRPEAIELSDDDDDDAPGQSTSARPRPTPVASTSKAAQPAASTSASTTAAAAASTSTSAAPARAPRASLPAIPTTSAPAKAPRPSLPAPRTAPLAPAPASTTSKGKQRAVDPDELPAASVSVVAAPAPPRVGSVEHAAEAPIEADPAAPFDEQDTAELVHQLARAELKGWTKDTVWKFMAKKLGRSPDDWRAFYVANVVDLLLQVARKVGEILAAQQRKREAAAAAAAAAAQQEKDEAERLERERAEAAVAAAAAAVAAAEAERLQREKEREEAQRRAREAEEQREREEQARLDAEEEARQRAAAEAAKLEREEKERVERAKVEKARAEQLRAARLERERARRKEGPSTSPPPFSSQGAQPVAAKPTSLGQPAASTVLTPRSTPPLRTAAAAPLFLPSSPTTRASIEAMYGADLDAIDEDDALPVPDASGSSVPHLSQYSVAPSPFLDAQQLVGAREQRDDDDELGSKADTDDRELDAQFSAAVAASIKVERDDDDALALEQHAGDDEDDDAPIWDPLLDVEYHLIIDSHELVEALSDRAAAAAAAPPLDAGPSAAVERPTPSSKKRRRTESPARAAADELEPQQQQPASKRQRVVVVDEQPAPAPVVEQPAPAHQPAATAASAAPPLRSSPAASRRVPRASLAAVAGSSPAPPPLPTPRLAASAAAPAPVPAPSPAQGAAPAPTPSARRPLKEELADVSASSGLSYMAVRDLYFCVSALGDMSILSDVAAFFSPAAAGRRPKEGTAEWDRARRRVDKYVWSAREDEVVLEGTNEARARVDERKGAGSVERRREFLRRAKMTKIADLRASLYARKA